MTQCIAIIPARGGSKGIPGKNLINIAGKPLVAWSIEHALKSTLIDAVWVTSDSQEILDVASNYGANTILRPDDISDDLSTS
ncbi:acylneuraminate cytidylyltransferase family protein, partial [Oceanospirillaceae bacterium]|nr:acylneuraminate cytidylyltransferase family protein [Oceanospirillaceae bacterium]